MDNRLNITLFGTYCVVGAVHLTSAAVRAGIKAYGKKQWQAQIEAIALGENGQLAATVAQAIGHSVPVVHRAKGIALHNDDFGMEVFHNGGHRLVEVVAAQNRALHVGDLVQEYKRGDVLGVFRGERPGVMFFRWDDAESVGGDDVVVEYETMSKLIPDAGIYELIVDVTYRGEAGRRPEPAPEPLAEVRQVLHTLK